MGGVAGLTASAAGFLVAAVHAVGVRVTAPAQGDAVPALALELVHVTAGRAVLLWAGSGHPGQTWVPRRPCSDYPLLVSLPTSSEPSAQSWSPSHFQRPAMQRPLAQENSLSEQGRGAGEGRDRPQEVGMGTQPPGHLQPLVGSYHPSGVPEGPAAWHDDQNAQPIPAAIGCPQGALTHPWGTHTRRHGSLALPSGHTACGEGRGRKRPLRQAPGFRERPVKGDGLRHSTGTGGLWAEVGCGGSTAHRRYLPLQPQEDSVKMERNVR